MEITMNYTKKNMKVSPFRRITTGGHCDSTNTRFLNIFFYYKRNGDVMIHIVKKKRKGTQRFRANNNDLIK